MKFSKAKKLLLIGAALLLPIAAFAVSNDAAGFTPPSDTTDGKVFSDSLEAASGMMYNILKTTVSIIRQGATMLAFAFGVAGYFMGANYVKKKQEQNQGNDAPQLIRIGIPIASAIMGLAVVFVVIGIFGRVFLDYSMSASWKWAVTNVIASTGATGSDTGD